MKIGTKILVGTMALIAPALAGCDNIADDDRYIALPAIEAKRVVLIEEFTGQNCVNCPAAHEEVAKLVEQYPDNVIAVSIHGGPMSLDETAFPSVGLATADGEAYYNESKVPAPPAAVINRNTGVIVKDQWAAAVRKEVARTTNLDMDVQASLSADGTEINITTTIAAHDNIDGFLQVWVLENGIVGLQLTETGFVADYEHSHVLRAAVNGHNGEEVHVLPRESLETACSIAPSSTWNTRKLEIVAFVYNSTGVLQAAKCKVE